MRELVALAVDVEHDGAVLDERDLAAAGLVHRRVARAAGARAGRQLVAAELGALAGQRRGEDLERVAGGAEPPRRRSAARTTVTRAGLVEAQQLAEAQLEAGGDAAGDLAASGSSRRARPG